MGDGTGDAKEKDLQNKRNELARKVYGQLYKDLCWIRQDIIDARLRTEDSTAKNKTEGGG